MFKSWKFFVSIVCITFFLFCEDKKVIWKRVIFKFNKEGEIAIEPVFDYSDRFIFVCFSVNRKEIGLVLMNKTSKPIKINWDEVCFITPEGLSKRVIHSGVRYIERDRPQAPSVIPPGGTIWDVIIPSENIYWSWYWYKKDLFPEDDKTTYRGKTFRVYMPLEIMGKKKEYIFVFMIDEVIEVE